MPIFRYYLFYLEFSKNKTLSELTWFEMVGGESNRTEFETLLELKKGVKSQIKEIKEDITSLATMVLMSRSSWMSSSSTREGTVSK